MIASNSALYLMEGTATMSILAQRGIEKLIINKRSDMEEKYIPGDLVMTIGEPIGTKKGIAYIITASDPNRTLTLKDGTVNKGVVTLDAITEEDRAHFVETSTWVKHIVPIPLTSEILEKNGWKKEKMPQNTTWYKYYTGKAYLYICKDSYIGKSWLVCVGSDKHYIANIEYAHQLQHLLFGLRLNSELKV